MNPNTILNDKRPIKCLLWQNNEAATIGGLVSVGNTSKITNIVAYGEPAQHCNVPWFAIYVDDEIVMRVPGGQVAVQYAPAGDEDKQ